MVREFGRKTVGSERTGSAETGGHGGNKQGGRDQRTDSWGSLAMNRREHVSDLVRVAKTLACLGSCGFWSTSAGL